MNFERVTIESVLFAVGCGILLYAVHRLRAALRTAEDLRKNLVESEFRFSQLADSIPQLAWMAKPDGWLFWYNKRWHEYTGTSLEEMQGWGWKTVHYPEDLPRITANWKDALERGVPWEDTFMLRRHDGEFRWHLSRAMPFRGSDGKILLWYGTNTDITDQKRNEEERLMLLDRERAARLESERSSLLKDEFLATLSHEIRTPLNAIFGWTQLLLETHNLPPELQEGLLIIERNSRAQTRIIEDLLDMSRIISGKIRFEPQQVDLPRIVAVSLDSVSPTAEAKGVLLHKILDPSVAVVTADPVRLEQVLWNLLSNAIKFTPKGGTVQLFLRSVESHIEIEVRDDGQGILPEFVPYVFDRFRQEDATTTRAHGGLGLGLAISKKLVELHGGTITAFSAGHGKGSSFIVSLPTVAILSGIDESPVLPVPTGAAIPREKEFSNLAGLRVLAIDDEPNALELIRRLLMNRDVEVFTAASACEALEMVKVCKPDVLLCDIGMPDKDGIQFIRDLREFEKEAGGKIPAVALTAFARSEDREKSLAAGYQLHLTKPLEGNLLTSAIWSLAGNGHRTESMAGKL